MIIGENRLIVAVQTMLIITIFGVSNGSTVRDPFINQNEEIQLKRIE